MPFAQLPQHRSLQALQCISQAFGSTAFFSSLNPDMLEYPGSSLTPSFFFDNLNNLLKKFINLNRLEMKGNDRKRDAILIF
jgi:hypothetical protein